MAKKDFLKQARECVEELAYEINNKEFHPHALLVWYCKTVQNGKAIFTTTARDGRIYEATYNGDKNDLYIDIYEKTGKITYNNQELKFTDGQVIR